MKGKPIFYVSKITGLKYDYNTYAPHGKCGIYKGYLDLPLDEYPYSIEYDK